MAIGAYLDPDPLPKSNRDVLWDLLWIYVPTSPWPGIAEQGEQAEWSGAGMGKGFNHLTTIPCPPVCPPPTAALGEPDQHGSAGELCQ